MGSALACASIWFLLSLHPHVAAETLALAGTMQSGFNRYDLWLLDLVQKYNPPNEHVLVITPKKIVTELAMLWWPLDWAEVPDERMDHFYGLVLVDIPSARNTLSTGLLTFVFHALVPNGQMLLIENGKVTLRIRKEPIK